MKRKQFLSMLAAAPWLASRKMKPLPNRESKGFVVKAGVGRIHGHIQLKGVNGNILDVKISGKDTDGDMAIFEQTSISPKRGTPLHIHPFQDEVFYVVEGAYYFQVGDDKYHLSKGDSIFLPRNVPHAWTQMSERGKMTVIFQPAGKMESFFVTMASLEKEPTPEEIAAIFAANEMEVVGPTLKID
ncbi:quercetin dioxygenase-like cupin family protein [Catalinimonas alkaloidigena]|uniref:cupin domain-containing protein n=1 Tax=Catalinimonas alkaloidigena TaxID=1075417 RepID=UPI002407215B|nr:cupin domain-containing protein [Catalinimonas alkaloidigena]MDF9800999.1 quercetin dioxygenase-like cupin family protein [Catalinimonas alkaloidigena]